MRITHVFSRIESMTFHLDEHDLRKAAIEYIQNNHRGGVPKDMQVEVEFGDDDNDMVTCELKFTRATDEESKEVPGEAE